MAELYLRKIQSAESKGHDFTLSFAQFKKLRLTKRCFYTGVEMTAAPNGALTPSDLTLDRVDASRGYVPGNVVACCHEANHIKSTFDAKPEIAFRIVDKLRAFKPESN